MSTPPQAKETFQDTFAAAMERLVDRLRRNQLVQGGALAGGIALASLIGVPGCTDPAAMEAEDPDNPNLGQGKFDWAQDQGTRDTSMISYTKMHWHQYTNLNGRYGYQGVDVFIKMRVRQVSGADLDKKRVGVEYRIPGFPSRTAVGGFFSDLGGGYEEWHVRVPLRSSDPHVFVFNAWYQDGKGRTFFDDNNGEFYPIAYDGSYSVIQQDWSTTKVQIGAGGATGRIAVRIADLDFDKDVRVRYSTDEWKTYKEVPLAYEAKLGTGQESWGASISVTGSFTRLHYAIVYRHGVKGGAQPFEFWDNNGGLNYVVQKP